MSEKVTGVIVTDTYRGMPRILLSQRVGLDEYTLPGGKRENGEDPIDTGRRELKEETGLECPEEEMTWLTQGSPIELRTISGKSVEMDFVLVFKEACSGKLTTREKDKHVLWKYVSVTKVMDLVINRKLPEGVININLIEILADNSQLLDGVFLPRVNEINESPSWIVT